jgi:hypothetical protein
MTPLWFWQWERAERWASEADAPQRQGKVAAARRLTPRKRMQRCGAKIVAIG